MKSKSLIRGLFALLIFHIVEISKYQVSGSYFFTELVDKIEDYNSQGWKSYGTRPSSVNSSAQLPVSSLYRLSGNGIIYFISGGNHLVEGFSRDLYPQYIDAKYLYFYVKYNTYSRVKGSYPGIRFLVATSNGQDGQHYRYLKPSPDGQWAEALVKLCKGDESNNKNLRFELFINSPDAGNILLLEKFGLVGSHWELSMADVKRFFW